MFEKVIKHLLAGEFVLLLLVCGIFVYRRQVVDSSGDAAVTGEQITSELITLDYEKTIEQGSSLEEEVQENIEAMERAQEGAREFSESLTGNQNLIEETQESIDGTEESLDGNEATEEKAKDYIKWVDFGVTCAAMDDAYEFDVESQASDIKLNWVELLGYLGAKYGGDFTRYKSKDMQALVDKLVNQKMTMEEITKDMKYYNYYYDAYEAVLGGFVGDYEIEIGTDSDTGEKLWETKYGLKAYLPIAKNFPYSDYDDFGVSRTYGFKRQHLGHDMMGQVGTPIIAVESGYVEALGWNQYGGWRIGIRSLDGKRYYYYAHLRKNFPYVKTLAEGSIVQAGDVIGYLGRTGYSRTENTNNIDTPHLHFGMQIIFDESQKECNSEIWIDCYNIVKFLYKNRSETVKNEETKEWYRTTEIIDPSVIDYKQRHGID